MNIAGLTTGLALCATLLLTGCSFSGIASNGVNLNGNDGKATVKKTVKINDFDEIMASQGIKVIFTQGANSGKADISTTPSAEKYLKVEVKNNTLCAYYSNNYDKRNVDIKGPSIIKVSSPNLNEVDLSSAANVTIDGNLKVNGNFELDLSSASSFVAGNVTCNKLDGELSSSASATIAALEGNLEAELSSASSINIEKFKGNLDAETSSASSINISSLISSSISAEASSGSSINLSGISGGNINAEASSGAKITLSGKAKSLQQDSSSGGSVHTSGLTLN
ncbi:MAG: DUF2807 domain-containing protein [Muribaculaceae bacterium]|nr:DUF2807 domain-containing protein [Muribaculaceae bacterium]MDE6631687.1 DUF2807 domain-containing protein [Muribaculaceae bacterium]